MKIVNNIEQGTTEWLNLRLGKATASNFSKIVTSTGKESATLPKYALELASQILVGEPEESFKSAAMDRGNELEPEAREAYEQYTFNSVKEITFFDCETYGYSPDGLIDEDGLLEIKCPQSTTHTKYLYEDRLPVEYKAQCMGGLMVSGRKYIDFCSYHPNFKDEEKLFIKRVERDEEFITKLKAGIDKVIELRDEYINKIKNNA